jgi:hypothetical protein
MSSTAVGWNVLTWPAMGDLPLEEFFEPGSQASQSADISNNNTMDHCNQKK